MFRMMWATVCWGTNLYSYQPRLHPLLIHRSCSPLASSLNSERDFGLLGFYRAQIRERGRNGVCVGSFALSVVGLCSTTSSNSLHLTPLFPKIYCHTSTSSIRPQLLSRNFSHWQEIVCSQVNQLFMVEAWRFLVLALTPTSALLRDPVRGNSLFV